MENKRKDISSSLKKGLIILFGIIVLLFLLVGFLTDVVWFKELGYLSVFLKKYITCIEIGIPVFVVITIAAYFYMRSISDSFFRKVELENEPDNRAVDRFNKFVALIAGGGLAIFTSINLWQKLLEFANSTSFDLTEPMFNQDVSWYIFRLPFLNALVNDLLILTVVFMLLTVLSTFILMNSNRPVGATQYEEEQEAKRQEEEERAQAAERGETTSKEYDDAFGDFHDAEKEFEEFKKEYSQLSKKERKEQRKAWRKESRKQPVRDPKSDPYKLVLNVASWQSILMGVLLFALVGIKFWLKQYDLLQNHVGAVYGAGYTDVHIKLWIYRAIILLAVIAAILFIRDVMKRRYKTIVILPLIMIGVFLLGSGAELIVQNYVVSPDELNKESKYLERNIELTQHAYGLDEVDIKNFSASPNLSAADIANNPETITNIRINDYTPTNKLYNQTQSIRQYYDFNDVDVDRYMIDDEYTQTFISAREINEENISPTFVNSHIKYTHGYGVALSRVDKVTQSGQADVLVGDIPPESKTESIKIDNPAIYFGDMTNDWVVVNTNEKEFDYPDGDSNQYTTYDGNAGIKMNIGNRILFAIK